jgi:hypothetical protein
MTREEYKKYMPILQRWADGEQLQIGLRSIDGNISAWIDVDDYMIGPQCIRIKPKQILRAWRQKEFIMSAKYRHTADGPRIITVPLSLGAQSALFVRFVDGDSSFQKIGLSFDDLRDFYQCSIDDGKTWQPCGIYE